MTEGGKDYVVQTHKVATQLKPSENKAYTQQQTIVIEKKKWIKTIMHMLLLLLLISNCF